MGFRNIPAKIRNKAEGSGCKGSCSSLVDRQDGKMSGQWKKDAGWILFVQ